MIIRRITAAVRKADFGALLLELVVLVVGILLALAADRWNQRRLDEIETARIVARLKSDTVRNLGMFEQSLPDMESGLANIKALQRALQAGTTDGEDAAQIQAAMTAIGVVPSYPLVFSAYDELVATGRLRQLGDPLLVDLLGNQRAEYDAAQAVVGYWRDIIQGPKNALDQHVEYYYSSERMSEDDMAVRFEFAALAADRNLRNKVFDAVDVHRDWLDRQNGIHQTTQQIAGRLGIL